MSSDFPKKDPVPKVPVYKVISHPYYFQVKGNVCAPDLDGIYHPSTEEELKALDYFASKGFCTKEV